MSTDAKHEKESSFLETLKMVENLFSKDGIERRDARVQLEKCGDYVTPFLIGVLKSKNVDARWEATKALTKIKDPLATDALTDTLMDEDYEVRWLAAEALIALGMDAIKPLLRKLLSHYDSTFLRVGAHHVLESLKKDESMDAETAEVLDELAAILPLEPYPLAAKNALETLYDREKKRANSGQQAITIDKR